MPTSIALSPKSIHRFKSEEHNFFGSVIDCTWMAGIRF